MSSDEIARRLDTLKEDFQKLGRKTLQAIIDQGRVVDEIYDACKQGDVPVTEWIPANLGVSINTARNFRRCYTQRNLILNSLLTPSAAYRLLAPGVPDVVSDRLLEQSQTEHINIDSVEREIQKAQLLGATLAVGGMLVDQHGESNSKLGAALKSVIEVVSEANERGAVTIDGIDVEYSELFHDAVDEHTARRKAVQIENSYAVDEEFAVQVGTDSVHEDQLVLYVLHAPKQLEERIDSIISIRWRERKDHQNGSHL